VQEAKEGATKLPSFVEMMQTMDEPKPEGSEDTKYPRTRNDEEPEVLGNCWKCGKGQMVSQSWNKAWSCTTASCDFVVWKKTASREMARVRPTLCI